MTKTKTSTPLIGHVRVPALDDETCPHCHAENIPPRKVCVWRIGDERGAGWECDVCAHYWQVPRSNRGR
jgi:hypothetical protein